MIRLRDDLAIVTTLDFFTPIVDDPYEFGYIAAVNALSDVYAMGGIPISALNIVCFPVRRLPLKILENVLRGAQAACGECKVDIVGGHSVDDNELKFGMSVTGTIHPDKIWRNTGCQVGDVLVLTKPIGVGIIMTAVKRGLVKSDDEIGTIARKTMMISNMHGAKLLQNCDVHACTDITGFGLLGHIKEMLTFAECSVEVVASQVPVVHDGLESLIGMGAVPGGTMNNIEFVSSVTHYDRYITETMKTILNDAQTSGGLCAAVSEEEAKNIVQNLPGSSIIGRVVKKQEYTICVI